MPGLIGQIEGGNGKMCKFCKARARIEQEWDNVLATVLLAALVILSTVACGLGLGVLAILSF